MFQKHFTNCYVQNYTKSIFAKQCTFLVKSSTNTTLPLLRPIIRCNYNHALIRNQLNSKYNFICNSINICKYRIHSRGAGYLLVGRTFYTKSSQWSPVKKVSEELLSRKRVIEKKSELKRLFLLAKKEKWYLLISIGCLMISSSVAMGVPYAIGRILDIIFTESFSKEKLTKFCITLFGVFIIGSLANFGRIYFMNSACE